MARFSTDPRRREIHWFTVTGSGQFPIDMLRFDMAWPASQDDAALIFGNFPGGDGFGRIVAPHGKRSIRMGCAQTLGPTDGRWLSFGWSVGDLDRDEVG